MLRWVVKKAGCHLDWFRSHILLTVGRTGFLKIIFQWSANQWDWSLFTERGYSQLSKILIHSPFGKFVLPFLIFTIIQARWLSLSKMTSCMPLCTVRFMHILPTPLYHCYRTFNFVEKTSEDADWNRTWSSAFYLDVKTSGFVQQIEFYTCKQIIFSQVLEVRITQSINQSRQRQKQRQDV